MKIFLLCGMIASGKSSYCKAAAKHGQIIVNDDAIVNLLHGNDYTLYDPKLKTMYKTVENIVVSMSLLAGRSVVIDRGMNVSRQSRQRFIALAKTFDVACEAIVFDNEGVEVHAKRRTCHDSRGHDYNYWLSVATCHAERYDVVQLAEGLDLIHQINYEEILTGKVFE